MNKYIDADKLITIIEERKAQQDQWINRYHDPINQGISQELTEILSVITSLQQEQPEVDWEKEIHRYFNPHGMALQFDRSKGKTIFKPEQLIKFARHFYELGLNARRGIGICQNIKK